MERKHYVDSDDEYDRAQDERDSMAMRHSTTKTAALRKSPAATVAIRRSATCGGGLRRCVEGGEGFYWRDDEAALARQRPPAAEPLGRNIPIGYARYTLPEVDPNTYRFVRGDGNWRVAIPRSASSGVVATTLRAIRAGGPAAAGYARSGDTLVPAVLGPGDRAALAGFAGYVTSYVNE